MFKTSIFSFFLLFSFFVSAQVPDSTDKNYAVFYYDNGLKSSEGILIDGKPDKYWISYYPSGEKKSEGNRRGFELDSIWTFYDESGRIKSTISYFKSLKHGISEEYDTLGNVISEIPYVEDTLQGVAKHYYEDENIKETVPYENGLKQGTGYKYGQDGRIISIIEYKHDFIASREDINRYNQQEEKEGVWKDFYDNSRLKTEARYKNGLLNGYLKKYDNTGKLISAVLYIDGKEQEEGENIADFKLEREYFPSGNVKKTITRNLSGRREGVSKEFNEEGELILSEFYRNGHLIASGIIDENGLKQGEWIEYYLNGNVKAKGSFLAGNKTGKWKYFFMNGELEQEGYFDNVGRYTGEWKWYYPSGKILRIEEYSRGKEDGLSVEYSEEGEEIARGEYIDGDKMGEWFYQLNDHTEHGGYRYDEKNGKWEGYYPNGKLSFEGKFNEGLPEGEHKYYFPSGVLKRSEKYRYGMRHGKWKWYDENGILTLTVQYKDDVEKKIDGTKVEFSGVSGE